MVVNTSTGAVADQITYDEFGNVLSDTNPGFQPFGFAGGLYDQDLKLVRFGARDYNPAIGRWTAKDQILFAGGDTNLYGYARADPVNRVDKSGLKEADCTCSEGFQGDRGTISFEQAMAPLDLLKVGAANIIAQPAALGLEVLISPFRLIDFEFGTNSTSGAPFIPLTLQRGMNRAYQDIWDSMFPQCAPDPGPGPDSSDQSQSLGDSVSSLWNSWLNGVYGIYGAGR